MQLPERITKFIDLLDTEAEDRILTGRLMPGHTWRQDQQAGCLIGLGCGHNLDWNEGTERWMKVIVAHRDLRVTPNVFDNLCHNHGVEAVGGAIRQYILDKRLSAAPAPEPVLAGADVG